MSKTDDVIGTVEDQHAEPSRTLTWASSAAVRQRMQVLPRRDTGPELALRRELHRRGLRYRLHLRVVPGTRRRLVDVVFTGAKVAVFVDGCFWHGCAEHGGPLPQANPWYWPAKIARNARRDADTSARLSSAGWLVLRVWEHEDAVEAGLRVEEAVRARRPGRRKMTGAV